MCGELGLSEAAISMRSADKEDHACLSKVRSSFDNAHLVAAPGVRLGRIPDMVRQPDQV
jgi:hypothetical protein